MKVEEEVKVRGAGWGEAGGRIRRVGGGGPDTMIR